MSSHESEAGDQPHAPEIIRPGPDAQPPLNVAEDAQQRKEKLPSLGVRLEARIDAHIAELKDDKQILREENHFLRFNEVAHLREDVRWLEGLVLWQREASVRLQTSYEWAIAFNWFSFALIAIGGGLVSLAAFISLKPGTRRIVAILGFTGLSIGVVMQAVISSRGTRALRLNSAPPSDSTRPRASPPSPQSS
jgi:hypothetical protein